MTALVYLSFSMHDPNVQRSSSFFPALPASSLLLGAVPAGSFLQAANEKGQGHGEDDDAAHHRGQDGHSKTSILRSGDCCQSLKDRKKAH